MLRVGYGEAPGWGSCGDPLTDPHPQPLPTRGRGAHGVRGMIKHKWKCSRTGRRAMAGSSMMLRSFHKRPEYLQALDRVKEWTRVRFKLPQDAAILVTEVACALPGCPPLETVVAFWTDADTRHHFKVFKPLAEVVADDLPPAWMKNALIAVEGEGLECC